MPEAVPGHPQPQPLIVRGMHFEVRSMTGHGSMASASVIDLKHTPHYGLPSSPMPVAALQLYSVAGS